jgi:hypothetical protein
MILSWMALGGLVLLDGFLTYVLIQTARRISQVRRTNAPVDADLMTRLIVLAAVDVGVVLMIVGLVLRLSG